MSSAERNSWSGAELCSRSRYSGQKKETALKFSEFMVQVDKGTIREVTVTGN
jgi:hypothetical protein